MTHWRVGEVVWAKIKGFPHWPAVVHHPSEAVEHKPPKKKNLFYIRFVDAGEKNQYAWVSLDDTLEFAPNLQKMKDSTENKGGKTYTDLKRCISIGSDAHQAFTASLAKDPAMATNFAMLENSVDGPAQASSSKPKAPPKTEKTPKKAKTPVSDAAAEPASAVSTGDGPSASAKRVRIKVLPDQSELAETTPKSSRKRAKPTPLKTTATAAKKRLPDEDAGGKVNGTANKRFKPPAVVSGSKKTVGEVAAGKEPLTNGKSTVIDAKSLERARAVSLSVIGLDDTRTLQIARNLLEKGVAVHVWSQDRHSTDLEYSQADRISDKVKLFDEADVIFISAPGIRELRSLLTADDHVLRKIRPSGKSTVKGVCVFSSLTKQESQDFSHQFLPKNLLYLECAWIGSKEHIGRGQMKFVACGAKRLFDLCQTLLEATGSQCSYLSEELGRTEVVKTAVSIAEGVCLAGLTEAAFFAQQNGLDLETFTPFLRPFGLDSEVALAKVRQILDAGSQVNDTTAGMLRDQYSRLRDAMATAHPSSGGGSVDSITSQCSQAMDAFQSQFVTYRHRRDLDRPYADSVEEAGLDEPTTGATSKTEVVIEEIGDLDGEEGDGEAGGDGDQPGSADLLSNVGLTSKVVAPAPGGSSMGATVSAKLTEVKPEIKPTNGKPSSSPVRGTILAEDSQSGDDDDDDDDEEASDTARAESTADGQEITAST